ncbi:MAG: aldo/keto reductase [Solirubrobacterales bacterium]
MSRIDLQRRRLGTTGIEVFPLGVGCWAIGGEDSNLGLPMGWSTADDHASLQCLFRAFELGANLFDTADVYGHGQSERLIGRFLSQVPRDQVVITSKVGYFAGTAPNAYQPLHLRHQLEQTLLEQTLDNLGTDYLDVYFLHNFDFGLDDAYLASAVERMRAFRDQGLVRAIGMRGPHRLALERLTTPKAERTDKHARFRQVFGLVQPDVLAVRYNLLTPDGPDNVFAWASRHRVGVLINKPLAQGLLAGKHDPARPPVFGPGDHRSRKRWFTPTALTVLHDGLAPLRQRFGSRPADLVRVALRFCLQRAEGAAVLVGFRGASPPPEQIEMNFTCLGEPLTDEDLEFVRATMGRLHQALDATGEVFLDEVTT